MVLQKASGREREKPGDVLHPRKLDIITGHYLNAAVGVE